MNVRNKKTEPTILYGWDMDRFCKDQSDSDDDIEFDVTWEAVKSVEQWLWNDELIVLMLMRQGKTPSDVASILDLKSRQLGSLEMKRTLRVVKFFIKWKDAIEKFPESKLSAREKQFINLFVVKRLHWRDIAFKLGFGKYAVRRRLQILLDKLPALGFDEYTELLKDAWSHRELREARYDDLGNRIPEEQRRRASQMEPWRVHLRDELLGKVGRTWYVWGGQDWQGGKLDCSGLVIEGLKAVGKLPKDFRDMTADGLMRYFKKARRPKLCDLIFYGKEGKAKHVMFFLGKNQIPGFEQKPAVIGMCGGKTNMTYKEALIVGAGLWVRRSPWYRGDWIQFGRIE